VGSFLGADAAMSVSGGLLRELESKNPKNHGGYRANKLHQWLTEDIGVP
jgi:hypothetical protein